MNADGARPVRLIDAPDEFGRTTASLIASLATRLITLHYTSGVSVIGSLLAGFAAAGREVARTAEGARLREALLALPAARNGEALWSALRIGDWASALPPSPVLDHVRNDLALLLAADLEETLATTPIPPETASRPRRVETAPVTFIDCTLGLWAHAREIVGAIETLAAQAPAPRPVREARDGDGPEPDRLLR
ncbi:MAG: hypothetical protein IRY94_03350 [Rhodospirillaceae bacterium]|nr:hypothetical protein [Rhodospirillaceae bacterium]